MLPFISVSGTHYECGRQIGEQFKDLITNYVELCKKSPPTGMEWADCLKKAKAYIIPTQKNFPEIIEEIKGVSDSTGISFEELFTTTIEELYSKNYHVKACTDLIVLPPASEHTFVIHNNDLPPEYKPVITSVEWNFTDGTKMFTVGLAGFLVSVGINSSGIVLTGNEVTPIDVKQAGIPRAIIARAILLANKFEKAVEIANHNERASSYNNIITTKEKSVSIEGSATDFEIIKPKEGILSHTNHYCSLKMQEFEGKPNYQSSMMRLKSVDKLVNENRSNLTLKKLKDIFKNHGDENIASDNTICRHDDLSSTLFSFIVNLNTGEVELTDGKPCEREYRKVWQVNS